MDKKIETKTLELNKYECYQLLTCIAAKSGALVSRWSTATTNEEENSINMQTGICKVLQDKVNALLGQFTEDKPEEDEKEAKA